MDGCVAREDRSPLWALLAPALYLAACALSVRALMLDPSAEIGVPGLLLAVGLVPAFVVPAVFSARSVKIAAAEEGLLVDGRILKILGARVAQGPRGSGLLHVELRTGEQRIYRTRSVDDARTLAGRLPPISAPAGALAV